MNDPPLSPASAPPALLPRLLYIGDQPVEATVGGPAALYRLLEDYPADKLRIVETNLDVSRPERRLRGVTYDVATVGVRRLQNTRFRAQHCNFMYRSSHLRQPLYARIIRAFDPEAILTISHGSSWITAAALAGRRGIPLHLILHDDIVAMSGVAPRLRSSVDACLGRVYRQAASRLCIGPMMEAYYRERYGVPGSVVYPSRSLGTVSLPPPAPSQRRSLVFGYAGSFRIHGYQGDLVTAARVLHSCGHRLLINSPACVNDRAPPGLDLPNVIPRSTVPTVADLLSRLRAEADVVLLPMNFDPSMRLEMELCFPSKLADYTATGLPILVWAPASASAARWAREQGDVAEVVESAEPEQLAAAIRRLEDPGRRQALGSAAAAAGDACFSQAAVVRAFHSAILPGVGDTPTR